MSRLPVTAIQARQRYVRANADLLVNDPDGWVGSQLVPVRWGDVPAAGGDQSAWWLGRDDGGGAWPIGPNGPWATSGSGLLPAVTRCTTVIVSTIVRTRWRYTGPGGQELPRPLWVDDPMGLGRLPGTLTPAVPSGLRLDGQSFWETWLTHSLWWGLGAFIFAENAAGEPTPGTLRLINPFLVGVDDAGHHVIDPDGDTPIRCSQDGRFIAAGKVWRLIVLRGLPPNDHRTPEGVLSRHFDTFRLGAAVSKYVAGTFTGMGVPAGLLKVSTPGFDSDEAEALKARWMAAHGTGRRSVAVLNSTVDFQPLGITPVDAGADSISRVVRTDVAHAFGLSSVWLDEGASGMNYNNNSDRRRDLVEVSLSGVAETAMATLSSVMPYGTRVEVDWPSFVQPSIEAMAQPLVQLVEAGILTQNEARSELGRVPIEEAS